jgi:hypothetical protein
LRLCRFIGRIRDCVREGENQVPSGPQLFFSGDELPGQFPVADGDIFDVDKIRKGLEDLRRLYVSQGFMNFTPVPKY